MVWQLPFCIFSLLRCELPEGCSHLLLPSRQKGVSQPLSSFLHCWSYPLGSCLIHCASRLILSHVSILSVSFYSATPSGLLLTSCCSFASSSSHLPHHHPHSVCCFSPKQALISERLIFLLTLDSAIVQTTWIFSSRVSFLLETTFPHLYPCFMPQHKSTSSPQPSSYSSFQVLLENGVIYSFYFLK